MCGEGDIALKRMNKFRTLKMELFLLCAVAFIICLFFHAITSTVASELIDSYFSDRQNIEAIEKRNLKSLQKYVTDKEVTLKEIEQIKSWSLHQENVLLKVYFNRYLIYDSIYGMTENSDLALENENDYSKLNLYNLTLKDAKVNVNLLCFDYTLQNNVSTVISIITILLFFFIIIAGVRKKIKYLVQLYNDLNGLSNNLNHEVHIEGCDEITQVAYGIDSLRKSVIEKIENEKRAYDANMQLITTLSHDIKTPLTSIIAFIELAKGQVQKDDTTYNYLNTAYEKSFHLNNLINELFSHFLLHSNSYEIKFEKVDANILVSQILEENLYELESKGTIIKKEISDISSYIYVNITLFHRLFNNIFSNINKYADLKKPILIKYYLIDNDLIIIIKNTKKKEKSFKQSSTKIGLNNCKAIMKKHNGQFITHEDNNIFIIELHFPIHKK